MKKLTTPEMNVIRFNEADVIVASGNDPMRSFTVSGVCNGDSGDATINYYNKEYKANNNDAKNLVDALHANGLTESCYDSSIGGLFPVQMLLYNDEEEIFSGSDGKWVYDPNIDDGYGAFVKKS